MNKIEPLEESIIIWEVLAESGRADKARVVDELYEAGRLKRMRYKFGCPLCEEFFDPAKPCYGMCVTCPWPGNPAFCTRCQGYGDDFSTNTYNIYSSWLYAYRPQKRMYVARAILGILRYALRKEKEKQHE